MEKNINNVNILLVEDNRINQAVVRGILEKFDGHADIASNGKVALDMLAREGKNNPYHIVLMDCQMPVMDGYQATMQIRSGKYSDIDKDIPIIAMTANAMKGDKEKCLEVGMNDYIAKPVDSSVLIEKVTTWTQSTQLNSLENTNNNEPVKVTEQKDRREHKEKQIWNEAGLFERVRNNKLLAKKLVQMFIEDAPTMLISINRVINKKEYDEVAAIAHKIKGSARNLGGEKLGEAADGLEHISKLHNHDELKALLVDFESTFNEFIQVLKSSDILV